MKGSGSNDNICTKTFGTPGSQQHWIFFTSYTAGSWSYWSIVLEEGSNKFYIVDQRHSLQPLLLLPINSLALTAGIQIDLATTDPSMDNRYYEFSNNYQAM